MTRKAVAKLVREMNCYYSNLIEGHRTLPREIEAVLRPAAGSAEEQQASRELARAHMETESAMIDRVRAGNVDVYAPDFICWIHEEFYRRLPETMHIARTKSGREYRIVPGRLRDFMVDVGEHTPPHHKALPVFLARFREFYGGERIWANNRLLAIAAAHHRLAWIHPFGDGNGRVARLHSHALLRAHGLDADGLWTLSRGLARVRRKYYHFLQVADQFRENDYDGRGNLSDRGLAAFCRFFLETMLDQVRFMDGLIGLDGLRTRIERHFIYEVPRLRYGTEIGRIVTALVVDGEIARERVGTLTGRGATTCAQIIKQGLREGYFESPSEKGRLRIAFPPQALTSYFPNLFIDLPVEQD